MKTKKTFKNFLFLCLGFTVPVVAITASCSTVATNKDEKVVFQLAQSGGYPLVKPLKYIAKIYNEQQKNTPDFLPVEIQDSEFTKTTSENTLAANVAKELGSIVGETNPSYDKVPDIILGSQAGAFVINQYKKLLDLSKSDIKKSLFDKDIYELHNKIPGQKTEQTYTVPFDITTLDGIVFNLDIMKLIFDQIKAGGGTVDTNSEIYKKVENADKEGNKEIPKNKLWRYMVAKDKNAFAGYTVNDATFGSYDKLTEFSKKVFDGLKLDESKIPDDVKDSIIKDREPKILMVDYVKDLFQKQLYNDTGANIGNSIFGDPDKFFWTLSKDAANGKDVIVYNYQKPSEKDRFDNILKNSFNNFIKNNEQRDLYSSGVSAKKFKSVYYASNTGIDWSPRDVKNYNAAIGIAPQVGTELSEAYSFTSPDFASKDPKVYNKRVTLKDIYWGRQVTHFNSKSPKGVFIEGGSSLVPISTTPTRNKATIKFITWLLKGTFKLDGKDVIVRDYLREKSSYIFPTKDRVSYAEYKKLKAEYDQMNETIDSLVAKTNRTEDENKTIRSLESKSTILLGAILSLGDLLTMKGVDLKTGNVDKNKRIPLLYISNDNQTSKFLDDVKSALINNTESNSTGTIKTGEQLVKEIHQS